MEPTRRDVLKGAGALVAMSAAGGLTTQAGGRADSKRSRGMARGLTVMNVRHEGRYVLAVDTKAGLLVVPEAGRVLHMYAPLTTDEFLQNEDGPALTALVKAATGSSAAKSAFIKPETAEYGPVVMRPEKIVCVGLNYRRHAKEIGMPEPKQPVLFNKFNNALNRHNGT